MKKTRKKGKNMWGMGKNEKKTCEKSYSTFPTHFRVLVN
jgi:hypothetical protein